MAGTWVRPKSQACCDYLESHWPGRLLVLHSQVLPLVRVQSWSQELSFFRKDRRNDGSNLCELRSERWNYEVDPQGQDGWVWVRRQWVPNLNIPWRQLFERDSPTWLQARSVHQSFSHPPPLHQVEQWSFCKCHYWDGVILKERVLLVLCAFLLHASRLPPCVQAYWIHVWNIQASGGDKSRDILKGDATDDGWIFASTNI